MPRPSTRPPPARVTIRLDLASGRIGPGKIALLDAIDREGSISAAARLLGMSYPRAWGLVEAMDGIMGEAVVTRAPGGRKGGGAALTEAGRSLIARYRAVEAAAQGEAGPPPKTMKA
jgi:molybdate transport system regulatory protein